MSTIPVQLILFFFLLVIMTLAIRVKEETWYSPFAFFALLWTFIIGFSIFTAPEYYFSVPALAFIMINIFVFYAGGFISENLFKEKVVSIPVRPASSDHFLKVHFYVATVAGFLSLYFLLLDAGVKFTELVTKERLVEVSKVFTNHRYQGERLSSITMLCMMVCYSGCLTAGRFFIFEKKYHQKIKSVIVLIPVLLFTIIYTARAVFIFAMLLFISSLITHYTLLYKKEAILFSKRNIGFMLLAFIGIPLIFFLTQAARMGISKFSVDSISTLADKLKVYFSGNLSAYSFWFDQADNSRHLSFGAYTFAGLNEWVGGGIRELGIYNKAYDLDGHFHFTNIYTLFRFLIDDFGTAGTILIWFGLGVFCRGIYVKILRRDFVACAVLSGILTWMLFSFITSVFAYNTVLFAWLIFVVITFTSERLFAYEK